MARPAPGAERTVTVLELLAAHPDERLTLSDVARRCGLNKATAHALLNALTERGVLLRHPEEKRYSLGPRMVAIGEAARLGYRAVDFVRPALDELAAGTGLWARAWAVEDDHIGSVCESGPPGAPASEGRVRIPLVPPIGSMAMAHADAATLEAWLARAGASAGAAEAAAALPAIRERGYSITKSSPEWREITGPSSRPLAAVGPEPAPVRALLTEIARQGLLLTDLDACSTAAVADVAAPVFDGHGQVTLVLSVTTATDAPIPVAEVRRLASLVVRSADALSEAVGGRRP